jgi:hypothetical protein
MAKEVYLARLFKFLQGLLSLEAHDTMTLWRSIICKHSLEEWVNAIDRCTLNDFKALLGNDLPLLAIRYNIYAGLRAAILGLSWTDTKCRRHRR